MIKMLNSETGKVCSASLSQVKDMEKAGWIVITSEVQAELDAAAAESDEDENGEDGNENEGDDE